MLSTGMLTALDRFFIIFHTLFTLFNIFGWIWRRTRRMHFVTMLLTASSWFILGAWYGWGYCFCTDWHWQVREALHEPIRSWSYIHFLIHEISGIWLDPELVDMATLGVFLVSLSLTIYLNMRDWHQRTRA